MKIAVTDNGNEGKRKLYLDWLKFLNPMAETVILSHTNNSADDVKNFDGLLLTGGEDVNPEKSKAMPLHVVGKPNLQRDEFEFALLDRALKNNMPILGICRGLQVANVFLGGTLYADLQFAGFQQHTTKDQEPEMRHAIRVVEHSLMNEVAGATIGEINSYHHQAVKTVAEELMISGYSDDNVIESLEWKRKSGRSFVLLVQWHPERMKDRENPFTYNVGKRFFDEVLNTITVSLIQRSDA